MRQFTEKEVCYEIGTKIYVSDFSGFFVKGKTSRWDYLFIDLIESAIRDRLDSKEPLVVVSEPFIPSEGRVFPDEYYIEVKFEYSPEVYCILNTGQRTRGIWTDFWKYAAWKEVGREQKEFNI